jgi:hypothetical protein
VSKPLLSRPAALALVLANFIPLWGVLFRGWDVANILHIYWAENLAFGLITILKILTNRHESGSLAGNAFLSAFFTAHYGLFCYGHSTFVFGGFFGGKGSMETSITAVNYLQENSFLVAGFFVSHLVSYFVNYLGKGEARRMEPGKVMFTPYRRIVILHVTIVIGGMAVLAMGNSAVLVAILVICKTAVDLVLHFREHRES